MKSTNQYGKPLSDRHAKRREQKLKYDHRQDSPTRYTDRAGKFTVPHSKGK
jgi:hypothetical protein